MLKNIRLHLCEDEKKQIKLDESLAHIIVETHKKNISSFARNVPSLLEAVSRPKLQNFSLFNNKFGKLNIVDYGTGRTFYGLHPVEEVSKQVGEFLQHAPLIKLCGEPENSSEGINRQDSLLRSSPGYARHMAFPSCSESIDCLVVLGCGLGLHILELMQLRTIKYLIVYEPELQYFQCSVLATKWHQIFDLARKNGTQLFLQIEQDGRKLISDINELVEHTGIDQFYLYQHYNHPVFKSLFKAATSTPWNVLKEHGFSFNMSEGYNEYLPPWTPNVNLENYSDCDRQSTLFNNNLSAFKTFFPDIYDEFHNYEPKIWLPVQDSEGQVNLIKADTMTPWYSDEPKKDCIINYQNYSKQPHKDGLVLGYNGTKLAHYTHYKFVKETEDLLEQSEDEVGKLPDQIASIIMFGIGAGYQLDKLLKKHSVEKLFICEPNRDFFYASLFAIDWQTIFESIDESEGRVYLNIGDDGSHLFRDLLKQFHSIGPYILNNTFFYQSYYNASLNLAIAQLREQLQIVISMGEYFDHAYYGIAHTKEGFSRNLPVLSQSPSKKLTYDDKEVPIFVIGNGPSLDLSIDAIKDWKDQAIVISCGTALQALHRNGITPDFHAEIEQNRSTFDWPVLIGDLDYLKKITLLSCNGIHPDTCTLFKNVMVAFKEGESSTVSALSLLGEQHFEVLQNAYPTVSNFVTNLVSVLGFNHIYLMGVDLGFIDVKHHHSKSSGYYKENGDEIYDYAEKNNTSIVVPGNFRRTVNTKQEFKISRQIIEQVVAGKPKLQTFYNCSDGAKILGANPLDVDNILIVATKEHKQKALLRLHSTVFTTLHNKDFVQKFEQRFSRTKLLEEFDSIEALLKQETSSLEQANHLINKQKETLFNSYQSGRSLLFYYLYGTMNYANAVLTKFNYDVSDSNTLPHAFNQAKSKWQDTLKNIKQLVSANNSEDFDISSHYSLNRELKYLALNYNNEKMVIVSDNNQFNRLASHLLKTAYPWCQDVEIITYQQSLISTIDADYCIYYLDDCNAAIKLNGSLSTIVVSDSVESIHSIDNAITYLIVSNLDSNSVFYNARFIATIAVRASFGVHQCQMIFPKYWTYDDSLFQQQEVNVSYRDYTALGQTLYVCVYDNNHIKTYGGLRANGSRGGKVIKNLTMKDLLFKQVPQKEFEKIELDNQIKTKSILDG